MAKVIKDGDFKSEVVDCKGHVLIDFWAEWCGPCRQMTPLLDKLAEELEGEVKIYKMNVDENPITPAKMGIRGIPAFVLFKNGEVLDSRSGACSYTILKEWIESNIQ
jgi:thioredoxin 1